VCIAPMGLCLVHQFKKETHANPWVNVVDKSWLRWVTLFTASSTLLCCAIPILLVSLGLGTVVASMNFNIPGLFWLAQNKFISLAISGLLLTFLAWMIWRPNQSCPNDIELANYCESSKEWNKRIFLLSVIIWVIGVFFSYILLPLRKILGV